MAQMAHLHNHTLYSMLDGVASAEQYAEACVKRDIAAMAITEHGHMGSVPDCYFAFKKKNIQYIPGCEIYYNDYEPMRQKIYASGAKMRSAEWKQSNIELNYRINRNRHLTVLCKNHTGFENLVKLTTEAYKDGLYGAGSRQYNRIWFDKLAKYKEGLIILSGCLNGPVAHELRFTEIKDREGNIIFERDQKEMIPKAVEYINKFKRVFGDDYYIELQMPGIEGDKEVFWHLVNLAKEHKIKTVTANDCHYLNRADFITQKIMMAISQDLTVDSPDLFHVNSDEQFLKSREELVETFINNGYCAEGVSLSDFNESLDNSLEIASKCTPMKVDDTPKIPSFEEDEKKLKLIVAKRLREEGFDKIDTKYEIDGKQVTYVEQAKIELDRYIDKGFASYFLITKDIIDYGRHRGWPFNPRGCSTPESEVAMANGQFKKIVDVEVGDEVYDGFGTKQFVENKFIYDISEELINIKLDNTILEVTCDHKFYIIRDTNVMLLKASELKDTDEIISPCLEERANCENNSSKL